MDIDIEKLNDLTLFTYKNLFGLLSRKAETLKTWKIDGSYFFEFLCQKLLKLYYNTYIPLFCIYLPTKSYRELWFNQAHLPAFQNISVKIYFIYFLSSGGYIFKINYLKHKMRHAMWVYILLKNVASSPLQHIY